MAAVNSNTPTSCQKEKEPLENNALIESNPCSNMIKKNTFNLQPVSPFASGEGLPYAPEGWPNPGDLWGWKVGRRINRAGYYHDRFLYLPRSLQNPSRRRMTLQSKPDVRRYLESNFPNMEPGAFFALFSWQVPSTELSTTEVKSQERKVAIEAIATQRKLKRKAHHTLPTRKSFRQVHVRPRCPSVVQDANANDIIDLCYLNEEVKIESTKDLKASSISEPEKSPNVTIAENFDDYLNTLEDILVLPRTETLSSDPVAPATTLEHEMTDCRKKLSSLLAMDFPSLISSNNLVEVATLASQLRKDPSLSVDQLIKLRLAEEIPLVSEAFQEAKGKIEEADKFFADLEAKKLKVPCLKMEYNELKDKIAQVQAEIDANSKAIQEIDDQVLLLQSKRSQMSSALEAMHNTKLELTCSQTRLANSIPAIVREIQLGHSEKPKWDVKKACCAQRVAEIQERFHTLKGLTF